MIVSFWRNEHLVCSLMNGLIEELETLKSLNAKILFICDSPEDITLRSSLEKSLETLSQLGLETELIINDKNEGFVRSTNKGLKEGVALKRDVLLLNSDAILTCGVISELRAAFEIDSMVGFASPRSNNASICTIVPESKKNCSLEEGKQIHRQLCKKLPRFRYVPSIVGFCAYIRYSMFAEFGLLNEIYNLGYHEENELVMLANRAGYRAVLANHAYVHHFGSVSFGDSANEHLLENVKIINQRIPEFLPLVQEYFNSPKLALEKIYTRRIDAGTSLSILFDLSNVVSSHNGTFQHAICVIKALSQIVTSTPKNIRVFVSIDDQSAIFHGIDQLENIQIVPLGTEFTFDAAIRIGQPMRMDDLNRLAHLAPVNAFFMEDTIAWDCEYLKTPHLDVAWKIALKTANGILFSSQFTRNQFHLRFGVDGISSLLSTNPAEYRTFDGELSQNHFLVVGNHFTHKAVPETVHLLAQSFPNQQIMVLGSGEFKWPNVQMFPAGHQSVELVHSLYRNASNVVFPSHYEGFGFPVMQAIAYGKRVFARNTLLLKEIAENCPRPDLIVPFEVIGDLPHLINSPKPLAIEPGLARTWEDHTADILHYILRLCADPNVNALLNERFSLLSLIHIDLCEKLQDRCHELEKQLNEVLQSNSWRATGLLRKSMRFFKGLKSGS